MRRACIDIGSNTTRLLVADCGEEGGLVPLHEERAFTRIGSSLSGSGEIPEEKLDEVVAAVTEQLTSARRLGAAEVTCVATAGVRHAANGAELVERVTGACGGVEVRVLTGEEEARCAFTGAVWGLGPQAPGRTVAVVDVGGGSTEIAAGGPPDRVEWWVSLAIGSAALARTSMTSDPPAADEIERARGRLDAQLGALSPPPVDVVIAVGGSANSLRVFAGGRLDQAAFARALAALSASPAAEIATRTGLEVARVRLMPAGILILEAVSRLFASPLLIGTAGLREGLLLAAQRTGGPGAPTSECP